jgi:hypothetical protein
MVTTADRLARLIASRDRLRVQAEEASRDFAGAKNNVMEMARIPGAAGSNAHLRAIAAMFAASREADVTAYILGVTERETIQVTQEYAAERCRFTEVVV